MASINIASQPFYLTIEGQKFKVDFGNIVFSRQGITSQDEDIIIQFEQGNNLSETLAGQSRSTKISFMCKGKQLYDSGLGQAIDNHIEASRRRNYKSNCDFKMPQPAMGRILSDSEAIVSRIYDTDASPSDPQRMLEIVITLPNYKFQSYIPEAFLN